MPPSVSAGGHGEPFCRTHPARALLDRSGKVRLNPSSAATDLNGSM